MFDLDSEYDVDLGGDRDHLDFAALQRCFDGPLYNCRGSDCAPMPDECWAFDVDSIEGVGFLDFAGDPAEPPQYHGFAHFTADPATGGPWDTPAP